MPKKILSIDETRNAFIAGVLHAAAPAAAKTVLAKLNINEIDVAIATTFLDATIAEIKANEQPEPKVRKKRRSASAVLDSNIDKLHDDDDNYNYDDDNDDDNDDEA